MIAIGLRDLAPFRFQAMTQPFLDLSLESVGTTYEARTRPSKAPTPSSPNFLEVRLGALSRCVYTYLSLPPPTFMYLSI